MMKQVSLRIRVPSLHGHRDSPVPDSLWLSGKWLPIAVGIVFLAGSLLLSQKLITDELADTARQVRLATDAVAQEITARIDLLITILGDLANFNFADSSGTPVQAQWESEARFHLRRCQYCGAFAWVDPALQARWVMPAAPQVSLSYQNLGTSPQRRQKLQENQGRRSTVVWHSADLLSTGAAIEVYEPIFVGERFYGYMLGVYPVRPLFDTLLKHIARRCSVAVFDGQHVIYSRLKDTGEYSREWSQSVRLFDGAWHVNVWPSQERLAEIYYPLPKATLIGGPLMTLLLALAIHLAQTTRLRAHEITAANKQLAAQIMERERAQVALAESEERYRTLYNNIPSMYFTLDRRGTITSANRFGARQLGYTPEELVHRPVLELVHPEDQEGALHAFIGELQSLAQEAHQEFRTVSKGGSVLWVSANGYTIRAPNGGLCLLVNCRNITERKEAEREQLATLHYLDAINQVAEAIAKTMDVETMIHEVIYKIFKIFDCDRAWLLHPCDADASCYRVPYEYYRSEHPGLSVIGAEISMSRDAAEMLRMVLSTDGAVVLRESDGPTYPDDGVARRFQIRSQMLIAIHPKIGRPWMLGLHQCSYDRAWTAEEQRLFKDISYRLTDALNNLLLYRNLRLSEEKYRSLFENSLDGIYRSTREGQFLDVNPALVKMLGYASREELLASDEAKRLCDPLSPALNAAEKYRVYPLPFKRKDDSEIWFENNCREILDDAGEVAYYEGIVRDVTERQRSQQALQESEERFRAAFEYAGVGMALVSPEGRWIKVNRSLGKILGYREHEFLGTRFQSVMHPDDLAAVEHCMHRMLADEIQCRQWEVRLLHKLGHTVWVLLSSSLVRSAHGTPLYFIAQAQDITEGIQAKQALADLLERFNLAVRGSNDGLWDVKLDSTLPCYPCYSPDMPVWYSPRFKELLGFNDDELENIATSWESRLHPDDRERVFEALRAHVEHRAPYDMAYRLKTKGGEYRWFSARGQAIWDQDGRIIRVAGSIRDITKAKELEQRQAATLHYLECMNQVSEAVAQSLDIETMMQQVIQRIYTVFNCDRAWLLYPCDPEALSFKVPYECTRPEYPGAAASGLEIPIEPETAEAFRIALAADGVVTYGAAHPPPSDTESLRAFQIRSQMDIAIRPKIGKPWLLGVHQCSYLREWTAEEQRLFRDISYRITDALNNVLLHRDLQRSEEKYRSLFENSLDGIYRCTADGRFIDVNPALVRMLGYDSKDELLCAEAVAGLYFSEEDRQWWPIRSAAFPLRLRRKDGREIWIESNTQPIRGEDRDVLYYEGILRDVTDRRRAEAEMTRLLEENRKLTQQSIAIQEEERRSLARELHDELGQCLTAIKADGVSICLRSQDSLPQIFESASAIVSVSSHVYDVVRSMMRRLRPSMLDELGLVETLNDAIADWRARYPDATYRFTVSGNLDHLGEAINITVYRIVQECLTNVVKHAQASHVDIQLARESMATAPVPEAGLPKGVQGDCVRLVISDDGRGMNTSAYTAGLGILGMRERVQALNGSFSLQSSPGHGVCVSTVIPILH